MEWSGYRVKGIVKRPGCKLVDKVSDHDWEQDTGTQLKEVRQDSYVIISCSINISVLMYTCIHTFFYNSLAYMQGYNSS